MSDTTPEMALYLTIDRLREKVERKRIKEVDACHVLMIMVRIWRPEGIGVKAMRDLMSSEKMSAHARREFCASLIRGSVQ